MTLSETLGLKSPSIRGGEIISRILAAEGVEKVFGIIDGTYFGFYSTLKAYGVEYVTPRHETSAAHMAGAYARVTGKLGVCSASNGPGVANILPGIAVENAEGNRVLLITSSRRLGITEPDRGGAFQYFPQVETIRPISKWSVSVPSEDRIAELLYKALRICWAGRPGVVHLDVPEDLMNGSFEIDPAWFREPSAYRVLEPLAPTQRQVEEAAKLLASAQRPLLQAGSGVVHAQASAELHDLAELIQAPITTSWGARSAVDERREQAISMIYVDTVNEARRQADLVLVLGSRLGETDWWGKAPYWATPDQQKLIQVDLDTEALGNNRPAALLVQADVKAFLRLLIAHIRSGQQARDLAGRKAWLQGLREACQKRRQQLDKHISDMTTPMDPAHVASVCRKVFDQDSILILDGGNTAIWGNFFHEAQSPYSVLGTPKMGMLGAGVGQTLGAKFARPASQVYCIIGDGAMGMQQQEIETAIRLRLPVIYLVLCDRQWGMVKMNQSFALRPIKTLVFKSLGPEETINTDLCETRFDDLARSMGAHGERVADPAQLEAAIRRAQASGRCAVIHVDVDPVKHMWAPNLRTFKDMHEEPKGK